MGGAEEDVWTAIKRTANRKCKSANAPAVVFGLAAVAVKSKQHEWLIQQLFKCRPSENSQFTLSEFSHCCIWLCLECVCALVFSSVELFTLRDRDESTLPCKWLCVSGRVASVVNGCSILITAGTSESHVPCPLQITRVNHLTLCMPKGLRSYPHPQPRLEPRSPTAQLRPQPSGPEPGPVDHGRVMGPHRRGMCETSLRAHKSERRLFKLDLFSLWCGWARYRLTAASSQNDDVMVSVFAKCKYQTGKELCPRNQCSSWS